MQQNDYDDFFALMEATAQLYGKSMTATVVELWFRALDGYDLAAVREGIGRHIQNPDTGQFMPKPADVVRLMQGTTQDSAMLAWSKVDKALRTVGVYTSVVFDDPIIHAVLADMGGWIALGNKGEKEWPFVANEFEKRYRAYKRQSEIEYYPPVLIGVAQAENTLENFPTSEPVLIGDKALALKTRQFGIQRSNATGERIAINVVEPESTQTRAELLNG